MCACMRVCACMCVRICLSVSVCVTSATKLKIKLSDLLNPQRVNQTEIHFLSSLEVYHSLSFIV